jgi:trk system potassium uptake protein TrkH
MSGFTTTGASILSDIESLPKSILFWRSMTTWLGGMGMVVLTIAIFPMIGMGGLQLLKAEATGPSVDKITPKITGTAKILWITYTILTAAETVLLIVGGNMDFFDAITHSFSTIATGGFSIKNSSIEHFNSPFVDWVIIVFMLLGGVNFIIYFKLITGKFQSIAKSTELKAYFIIYITATVIITFNLINNTCKEFGECIRNAGFHAASIMTTTGFSTSNYEKWPMLSQIILFILMFTGACSGSTSGGIKVIRIVTLVKQGINEMRLLIRPKGVFSIRIDSKVVNKHIVYSISGFVLLYIFLIFLFTAIVSTGDHDLITSLSAAISTIGNIGPGFGNIGCTDNYGFFQDYIKYFLSFAMLLGRLEIYTVMVIFLPSFWKK